MNDIHKTYQLPFDRNIVFEAWISTKTLIPPVTRIESNAVVGGVYKLWAESQETVGIMNGNFLEVVPEEKLSYTWQWEGSDEKTVIVVQFDQKPEGTTLHLRHSGFLTEESRNTHDAGWDSYINGLNQLLQLS